MFPYGDFLRATTKYTAQCITRLSIKPNDGININCDVGFCEEFPEYIIPDEELDYGKNASLIHFSVYTHQGIYVTHGIITNGPSLCRICE